MADGFSKLARSMRLHPGCSASLGTQSDSRQIRTHPRASLSALVTGRLHYRHGQGLLERACQEMKPKTLRTKMSNSTKRTRWWPGQLIRIRYQPRAQDESIFDCGPHRLPFGFLNSRAKVAAHVQSWLPSANASQRILQRDAIALQNIRGFSVAQKSVPNHRSPQLWRIWPERERN
jgi:hypothetical protein